MNTRAWLLTVCLLAGMTTPLWAATRVTITDLKAHPEQYEGDTIQLECYYDKESPIWVRALPDADQWMGFFVTGKPDRALTWNGEYYNLLFAPAAMREPLRTLRGGDQITVVGDVFRYEATSFTGAGIHVRQLSQGWGPSAKVIGAGGGSGLMPEALAATPGSAGPRFATPPDKYTVTINGKRYDGLRFGDPYNFDGIQFQVDGVSSEGSSSRR